MMHIARMASLLVAFYILASAATAYAEGVWASWEHMESGSGSPPMNSQKWPKC